MTSWYTHEQGLLQRKQSKSSKHCQTRNQDRRAGTLALLTSKRVVQDRWFNSSLCLHIHIVESSFIYWSIVALQCHAHFCCVTKWISYRYTYTPSPLRVPPTPSPSPPIWVTAEHRTEFCVLYSGSSLDTHFTQLVYICRSRSPNSAHPTPSPGPHVHPLRLYSCPANRFICTIFLDSTNKHYYMMFIFLFLIYFTLYERH